VTRRRCHRPRRLAAISFALLGTLVASASQANPERAGATPAGQEEIVCEASWSDPARDRNVPVRIRMPGGRGKVPVVLFSHGLGGSLDAGTVWARHWVRNGIAVIHLQHPGSDQSLLAGLRSRPQALAALQRGIGGSQLIDRTADVRFVLDRIETGQAEGACALGRLDLDRVGMAGHSFGAHTAQAVSGQSLQVGSRGAALRDPRIDAAIGFSPAPPQYGDARGAFATITIPFLSFTGTRDTVPALTSVSAEDRTLPFRFMPPGGKYLVVFEGADHAAFSGRPTAGLRDGQATDPGLQRAVEAISLRFWQAHLLGDDEARAWLTGGAPRAMVGPLGRYEAK